MVLRVHVEECADGTALGVVDFDVKGLDDGHWFVCGGEGCCVVGMREFGVS